MKNAYQRRRVKARVEKSARMKRLDAITLDFARQVIEEETGTPLDIKVPPADMPRTRATEGAPAPERNVDAGDARLVARDDRQTPLISTFNWTNEAVQRIFRVPAGFMRNKTQERVEELAHERAATGIDLALVEDGIEFGKKMMAEMMANYTAPGASPVVAATAAVSAKATPKPDQESAAGGGYLNEVRSS
jgi:hypothetical protein